MKFSLGTDPTGFRCIRVQTEGADHGAGGVIHRIPPSRVSIKVLIYPGALIVNLSLMQ